MRTIFAFSVLLVALAATASGAPGSAVASLADHLDRAEAHAERLRQQVAHPRGRPTAAGELVELAAHLERLQRATAELGAEGSALEARRVALLMALRRGPEAEPEAAPVAGGGSISGLVTGPNGQPLSDIDLQVNRIGNGPIGIGRTDAGGFYQIGNLADGRYLVSTNFYTSVVPYLNETYDDLHCPQGGPCRFDEATAVTIENGAAVSGIHFRLSPGGRLRGRVADLAGTPIAGAILVAYDSFGSEVRSALTDVVGRYDLGPLVPGTYRLRAMSDRHVDELYPDLPCESFCDPTSGTPIAVALSQQINGLDFALKSLGRLSGKVTDAVSGEPLPHANIRIVNADQTVTRYLTTNQLGEWVSADLPAGTYFASAEEFGYQSQLFDGIPCPPFDCEPAKGDAIFLPDQGSVAGIDFALGHLGAMSGSVKAAGTLALLEARVEVYDPEGFFVASDFSSGAFEIDSLYPGIYFVRTDLPSTSFYQDELWQNRPCVGECEVTTGDPVNVAADEITLGIDFVLDKLGAIAGHVISSASGLPIAELNVTAYRASDGNSVRTAETGADGSYRLEGLPTGDYKVAVRQSAFRAEVWDGIPCGEVCDVSLGQNVPTGINQVTTGIDFALERLGRLSGIVRDETTQEPLAGIAVLLSSSGAQQNAITGDDGRFILEGLLDGTYYAEAHDFGSFREYFAELYDGIDCGYTCPAASGGTPVAVTLESARTDIDFTLRRGGSFTGILRSAATGLPVAGTVTAFDAAGQAVRSDSAGSDGSYALTGLAAGSYHLMALPQSTELAREIWPSWICPVDAFCNPLQGTPLTVALGGQVAADFSLDTLGRIEGRVIDAELGTPIGFGDVGIIGPAGTLLEIERTDAAGRFTFTGLDTGTYRLRSFSHPSHIDRILGGESCEGGACNSASGTPIAVQIGQTTTAPDFALAFGPGLAGRVSLDGIGAANVGIDIWSSAGAHLAVAASWPGGKWRIQLPAGTYYVSTDNGPAYVDEIYDGVGCPNGPAFLGLCDPLAGTPLAVDGFVPATPGIDMDLAPRVPAIFGDGFESGGFGAWSQVLGN